MLHFVHSWRTEQCCIFHTVKGLSNVAFRALLKTEQCCKLNTVSDTVKGLINVACCTQLKDWEMLHFVHSWRTEQCALLHVLQLKDWALLHVHSWRIEQSTLLHVYSWRTEQCPSGQFWWHTSADGWRGEAEDDCSHQDEWNQQVNHTKASIWHTKVLLKNKQIKAFVYETIEKKSVFFFSRAHTIVTVNFAQKQIKKNMTKYSAINLVDLAGR